MKTNISADPKTGLTKKAFWLAVFTVSYNILEGIFSVIFGKVSNSIALISFGLDSFAESLSGFVVLWRFFGSHKSTFEDDEKKEKLATKLVGYTFFIFGAYVLFDVIRKFILREIPEKSLPGIIILILSVIIMPVLFYQKYDTGKKLNSKSLIGDSKETLACVFLSVIILFGLAVNYFFRIWWLDSVLALFVCGFLFKEGFEILTGEGRGVFPNEAKKKCI